MSDRSRTKRTLAESLMKLMKQKDFGKISVKDICIDSGINRKTFYYHFYDKYALLDWTFYMDCIDPLNKLANLNFFEQIKKVIYKINENKSFYRKAFSISPTNSFIDPTINSFQLFFVSQIKMLLINQIMKTNQNDQQIKPHSYFEYYLDTVSGSLTGNIQQWLLEHPELDVEDYLSLLEGMVNQNLAEFHLKDC